MDKALDWLTNEEKVRRLSSTTSAVFEIILKHWPTNPLEVAKILGEKGKEKSLSAKYLYHFKKLYKLKLIRLKKIGNTFIAWPVEIEKLRVMKEIFG